MPTEIKKTIDGDGKYRNPPLPRIEDDCFISVGDLLDMLDCLPRDLRIGRKHNIYAQIRPFHNIEIIRTDFDEELKEESVDSKPDIFLAYIDE